MRKILCALLVTILVGCETLETKREAFPKMYDAELKPISLVVVPAVNKTTAADAGDLITATIPQPFADNGYYVLPLPIVNKIFQEEGVVDGMQMISAPASMFREAFGADAVLYVTIEEWETNYIVLAANVTVGLSYVLRSTTTDEVLWSYKARQVVDTAGPSSGFLLLDVIKTADWLVDLGPEGGSGGGLIIAEGTPEQVAKKKKSHTGQYLRPVLEAAS